MTAKEYLEQLPNMQMRINAINRKIKKCEENATNTATAYTSESFQNVNSDSNKITINVEKKVDLENELRNLKEEFEMLECDAIIEINKISNNLYVAVLLEKYVNSLSWEKVAEVINRESDYTRKVLHSKALLEFEKISSQKDRKNPVIPLPKGVN